jgi:hypothetical protein
MSLLWLLVVVFVLIALVGNPHVGGGMISGYSYGYWPSGIGIIVVIVLLFLLLGRG